MTSPGAQPLSSLLESEYAGSFFRQWGSPPRASSTVWWHMDAELADLVEKEIAYLDALGRYVTARSIACDLGQISDRLERLNRMLRRGPSPRRGAMIEVGKRDDLADLIEKEVGFLLAMEAYATPNAVKSMSAGEAPEPYTPVALVEDIRARLDELERVKSGQADYMVKFELGDRR